MAFRFFLTKILQYFSTIIQYLITQILKCKFNFKNWNQLYEINFILLDSNPKISNSRRKFTRFI